MSQLLVLLRAKCAYCSHLKLVPAEVHRYICKLRLIEHGLIAEVKELENIHAGLKVPSTKGTNGHVEDGEAEEGEGEEDIESEDENDLQRRREKFVRHAIRKERGSKRNDTPIDVKIETISEVRRAIVKEFLAVCTKIKTCGTCKGYFKTSCQSWKTVSDIAQYFTGLSERKVH